ncbi:hypothetical protein SAMN05444167_1012 [Terriglobus roseus]|uniref:Uncharacterized protein n=1 Tax=Terriglobus roseus TaxID=392734 RepID=A0A1G7HCB8_9BACT|nr:hypothetical protein SAMN05444167_1012 [Terriglobus roseus]
MNYHGLEGKKYKLLGCKGPKQAFASSKPAGASRGELGNIAEAKSSDFDPNQFRN